MPRFNTSSGKDNLVALRAKRKTTAELVNDQLEQRRGVVSYGDDQDGAVEDYDFDTGADGHGSDSDDARNVGRRHAGGGLDSSSLRVGTKRSRGQGETGRLRRRGPLDSSLSEGVYAATPVNVEAAMDDLFGALDMGDMDAEGKELVGDSMDDGEDGDGDDYDDDEEDDEDASDEERDDSRKKTQKTARARRAKNLSEEEYTQWVEKRQQKKAAALAGATANLTEEQVKATISRGPLAGEEVAILQQLEALRQAQIGLVGTSTSGGAAGDGDNDTEAAAAHEREQVAKERAGLQALTRRYLHLFGQLLRVRVKLQPAVNHAMRLPQYYALPLFLEPEKDDHGALDGVADKREKTALKAQASAVREKEVEVQEALKDVLGLLWRVTPILDGKQIPAPTRKRPRVEKGKSAAGESAADHDESPAVVPDFDAIERYHQHMLGSVKSCLDLWGRKLVQTNSAKLTVISQPLTQQIEAVLASKTRLLHKVQKNRAHVTILGHPTHVRTALEPDNTEAKVQRAMQVAGGDVDDEVFDDGDFLRELVRRGGVLSSRLEQQLRDTEKTMLPQKGPSRKGFHRLTKGKTVSYEPHPKLVGFVVPEPIEDSGRKDVVLQSLFQ